MFSEEEHRRFMPEVLWAREIRAQFISLAKERGEKSPIHILRLIHHVHFRALPHIHSMLTPPRVFNEVGLISAGAPCVPLP